MDAKQQLIMENQAKLYKMKLELGLRPTMTVSFISRNHIKSTFNLRDLNKELTKKQ